jgi:hypothetical protein
MAVVVAHTVELVAKELGALQPVDLHLQVALSLINKMKFNFKGLHHFKILDLHTLVEYNGDKLAHQSQQNKLLINQLTNQRKTIMQPSSDSLLPVVRKEWTRTVTTSQFLPSRNSLKHLQLIYLTSELQTQSQQRQDSAIY